MRIFEKIKRQLAEKRIIPFERNEICYCESGLKYKNCHGKKLASKNRLTCKILNDKNEIIKIKIFKSNSLKTKSNLTWNDIGVGSKDKLD